MATLRPYSQKSRAPHRAEAYPHFYSLSPSTLHSLSTTLRSYPTHPTPNALLVFEKTQKALITKLPRPLRATGLHRPEDPQSGKVPPGFLCSTHKGLKKALCYEMVAWIRDEVERKMDCVVSPVLSIEGDDALNQGEKTRLTAHEALRGLWNYASAAAHCSDFGNVGPESPIFMSREGVSIVTGYAYQENECPACILARIGSDIKAQFALLAGMIARISSKGAGSRQKIKSQRIRFLVDWLLLSEHGSRLVDEAWELGRRIRRLRKEMAKSEREDTKDAWAEGSTEELSRNDQNRTTGGMWSPPAGVDFSDPYMPDWSSANPVVSNPVPGTASRRTSPASFNTHGEVNPVPEDSRQTARQFGPDPAFQDRYSTTYESAAENIVFRPFRIGSWDTTVEIPASQHGKDGGESYELWVRRRYSLVSSCSEISWNHSLE